MNATAPPRPTAPHPTPPLPLPPPPWEHVPPVAELRPYPFAALVRRMFREHALQGSIFDLPERRFFRGDPQRDLAVDFHGRRASSPLGPAAGPQTQMAQNLVLSWLGGSRVQELKTVQVNDRLEIPRPCIDMRTVGLNIEWSQELLLEESLEEYVKGAMLIRMLETGPVPPTPGFADQVLDMSVGYDLAGIQSEPVASFLRGMLDCSAVVDRLRDEIPPEHARLRDLDYPTRLSDTLTLSTFHGCPPDEIERIVDFLMHEYGISCVVKFNPMLVGREETRSLLHDELGYTHLTVPDSAFERDATWEQALEITERLDATARRLGVGFGVKFSNTLIVLNDGGFLAGAADSGPEEAYLSGRPLHVLAMTLVRRFRRIFGTRIPISFSAGIDRVNFPDAVALGLVPITVCSDLLEKGGYGRLQGYYKELDRRMDEVGAHSAGTWAIRAYGKGREALERAMRGLGLEPGDPRRAAVERALAEDHDLAAAVGPELFARWVDAAVLLNTEEYVEGVRRDPRYAHAANSQPPPKIGSHLELFDCITCDICVPVCPNDANFTFGHGLEAVPVERLERRAEGGWRRVAGDPLDLSRKHQIANFADFCNDCGNCDVFCPEDGGPYVVKPRFFGSDADWRASPLDGFWLGRAGGRDVALGRFRAEEGNDQRIEMRLTVEGDRLRVEGPGFEEPAYRVAWSVTDPEATLEVDSDLQTIDLTWAHILDTIRRAVLDGARVNPVNALVGVSIPPSEDNPSPRNSNPS